VHGVWTAQAGRFGLRTATDHEAGGLGVSSVRGRGRNLEIAVDRDLGAAAEELRAQFSGRPDFYRGSRAVANLGALEPSTEELIAFRDALAEFGIELDGVCGVEPVAAIAAGVGLAYLGAAQIAEVAALPRKRQERDVRLSESARSLVADFAGARADMARRRVNGPSAGAATVSAAAGVAIPLQPRPVPAGVATLYHRGTLRGGQALHNLGNLVVVGDVNPGAELVASGDIVVFGALRGVAHAGAQGDRNARVIALELAPTQLRIATAIATSGPDRAKRGPEHASIVGDRIVVVPFSDAELKRESPV
jgi:septum formation inhibitor MinC